MTSLFPSAVVIGDAGWCSVRQGRWNIFKLPRSKRFSTEKIRLISVIVSNGSGVGHRCDIGSLGEANFYLGYLP